MRPFSIWLSLTSCVPFGYGSRLPIVVLRPHSETAACAYLTPSNVLVNRYQIAKFFERGIYGYDLDMFKAAIFYGKAADQGHLHAQYRLSLLYFKGAGVQMDHYKSVKLFECAKAREPRPSMEAAFAVPGDCPRFPRVLHPTARGFWD